jgi:hypothetical protein
MKVFKMNNLEIKMKQFSFAVLVSFASMILLATPSFAGNTAPYKTLGTLSPVEVSRQDSPYELWLRPSTVVTGKSVRVQTGSRFFTIDEIQNAQKVNLELQKKQDK